MLDKEQLTALLSKIRTDNHVAGMSVAVTDGKRVIYNQGFGFESAERSEVPAFADAMFKIASMTKTVTAVMILRLCEEGVLDLDTPIKNYLPWLKLSRPEAEKTMTLRHLLIHTAGMPGDTYLEEGSRDEDTMDAVIQKLLPDMSLSALPEDGKFLYSSWGYNLIGCVASAAAGKPYTKLVSEYVLDPLGMTKSTFDYQIASTYPISLPHRKTDDGGFRVLHHQRINTVYHAGAGLYSNTTDMCKFARFLINDGIADSGERLLTEDSFRDLIAKHILKSEEPKIYYGLGTFVRAYKDRYIYGHTGNYDPYNSSIFVDRKTGCGVVTMFNSHITNIRNTIPEMIFDMMDK